MADNTRFISTNPATGEIVWEGRTASGADCAAALARARAFQPRWADTDLSERIAIARRFAAALRSAPEPLAEALARENGKPLWEAREEVAAAAAKVDVSIAAQEERAGRRVQDAAFGRVILSHRPHGVLAVLGPFNFPIHLANGHFVPALLAGNTILFKPSEHTPLSGELLVGAWRDAGLPHDALILLQGGAETGAALAGSDVDGLLFTGSAQVGQQLQRVFAERPGVMLALELGGNNPLIAWDGAPEAAASVIVQSAFISAGQRCSCARRLIVPDNAAGAAIIDATAALARRLRIGAWNETPEPFMGPLISAAAARRAHAETSALRNAGARVVLAPIERGGAFTAPTMLDVTGSGAPDAEIFAPVLQITRVRSFDEAIAAANATRFGLSAALLSEDDALWDKYLRRARAGVVNRNRPTTGASASMPFGGLGASGNHRPSAYYAADYCAYPVASAETRTLHDLTSGFAQRLESA